MKTARICWFFALAATIAIIAATSLQPACSAAPNSSALHHSSQQSSQAAPTIASLVDRDIAAVEKLVIDAADSMPEDRFNFTPETLDIPGAKYEGVRSFALEVKHIAASNWLIWSALTGDKFPDGLKDGSGPANLQTKADIVKFLKDSFALGHRAAATLTPENILQPPGNSKSTRLHLAEFGVAHAYDHYGQMVEYLRMNGIVPPSSRAKSE